MIGFIVISSEWQRRLRKKAYKLRSYRISVCDRQAMRRTLRRMAAEASAGS